MEIIKFKTKLKSNVIKLENSENLIGKKVEITIKEIVHETKPKRKWSTLGSLNLGGKLDDKNIRDLAYE